MVYQRVGDVLMPIERNECLDELRRKELIIETSIDKNTREKGRKIS